MASLRVGRYETLRPIASGGMATVYLGRSRGAHGFERQVAIKAMHPHLADDPEFVAMFLDEARMASNIRHPNVVPTLDIAEEEGRIFLVMEYIEGLSLQAMLRAVRKNLESVPLPIALRILLDMLAGLHAAHELRMSDGALMRLVHRDVSPQNVLVGADGIARIMDFGIAHAETRITSTRGAQVKGKVPYMSPEQLEAGAVDRRSDVYAAGIVTWELLAGERLFRADDNGLLLNVVLRGAREPPSRLNRDIPARIDAVCMRALALSPGDRFSTAAAFAEALEEAAAASHVGIASARALAAFVKALPPLPPPRGLEVHASSGGTPSSPFGPLSLEPSSVSTPSGSSTGGRQPASGVSAGTVVVPGELARGARSGARAAIAAAIVASLLTGVTVWILARDHGAPQAPATSAPQAPTAAMPAAVETSPPVAPLSVSTAPPAPSENASAKTWPTQPEPPRLVGPKPPTTRRPPPDKLPPPKGASTAFRPEEP
jgi:serine/threonine protein kinase